MVVVLPAPVGAEQAEALVDGDREVDRVHGDVVAEPLGQPADVDRRRGQQSCTSPSGHEGQAEASPAAGPRERAMRNER
jgi:hypothetical protein